MDQQPSSTPVPVAPSALSAGVRGVYLLFRDAWNTYGTHLKNILLFQLIIFLVYIGGGFLVAMVGSGLVFGLIVLPLQNAGGLQLSPAVMGGAVMIVLFFVVVVLAAVWVGTAQSLFYLRLIEAGSASIGTALKEALRRFLAFLGTSIVTSLIVLGGLLLLVVPGIYWGLRFSFAPFACLAEGLGVGASLRRSWALTENITWIVLARWYVAAVFGFALGLLQIIPIVGPFILAPFFITPLLGFLSWYLFREFQRVKNVDPSYRTPYGVGKKIALLLPLLLIPLLLAGFISVLMRTSKNTDGLERPLSPTSYDELYKDDFNGEVGPSDVPIPPAPEEGGGTSS